MSNKSSYILKQGGLMGLDVLFLASLGEPLDEPADAEIRRLNANVTSP